MGINIQSNAMRGSFMREYVDRTIHEIHDDVLTVFGPGAADAYLTKNGQPYFTRDGLEVLESLTFDNVVSEYVRKILFQAAYRQGKQVGDGSTTLIMFYTNLYRMIRNYVLDHADSKLANMSAARPIWNHVIKLVNDRLDQKKVPLTEDKLLSMIATCTQDDILAAKLYHSLKDPIMNHAYIVVNKSNIEDDFQIISYEAQLINARRLFTVRPIAKKEPYTVILHCNGMLDIAHVETLWGLMNVSFDTKDQVMPKLNIVLLCNGITDVTRRSTKELIKTLQDRSSEFSPDQFNNVAIYAINDYRGMSSAEIEDLSTMITDEPGIGGLVNDITFESMLYQAFSMEHAIGYPINELATFDADVRLLDKLRWMLLQWYPVEFDDAEGLKLDKPLGPVAKARYDKLIDEIEHEKSDTRKVALNRRLRKIYGQFIELEVGSKLIKDSQRKFELILDVILSAAEAVRDGVLECNSIAAAIVAVDEVYNSDKDLSVEEVVVCNILSRVLLKTFLELIQNYHQSAYLGLDSDEVSTPEETYYSILDTILESDLTKFDLFREGSSDNIFDAILPRKDVSGSYTFRTDTIDLEDGASLEVVHQIIEPVNVIKTILENVPVVVELATAKTIHVEGFMQNYI